jgi:hypothetical protein
MAAHTGREDADVDEMLDRLVATLAIYDALRLEQGGEFVTPDHLRGDGAGPFRDCSKRKLLPNPGGLD